MKFRVEKQEEHITKTFRMPRGLIEHMERLAAEKNISLNRLMILCARFAMENMDEDA